MTETRGGTAAPERAGAKPLTAAGGRGVRGRGNPFAALSLFFKQVVAELRKVIWPTRQELITYTTVVIVFVTLMVLITAGFDLLFGKGVLEVFG
ncbi:MAG: preprotein translocase subunit SecE [Actinomycetota bacterium]|nr:preprotein translocase subunit SecE [Actinomycetota bacterium]